MRSIGVQEGAAVRRAGRLARALLVAAVSAIAACTSTEGGAGGPAMGTSTAPVATVTVSPAADTLLAGDSQHLAAVLKDAGGRQTASREVTWESTQPEIASVTATGLVEGHAAGAAEIVATSEGKSGRALITVWPVQRDPRECDAPRPEWIWCDDFEQDRFKGYFEYEPAGGSFARLPGVGYAGSAGMRARFGPRQVQAGFLHLAFGKTPSSTFRPVDAGVAIYREIYWRHLIKHAPGWTGGGGYKLSRAQSLVTRNWAQAMMAHVWSPEPPDIDRLSIAPASGTDGRGLVRTTTYNDFPNFRWIGVFKSRTPIFDAAHVGKWYCVEARAVLNGPGRSDGVFEVWINGALEMQATRLNWHGVVTEYGINTVFLENYWNTGSPKLQERYFDNFVVSTQRIGC